MSGDRPMLLIFYTYTVSKKTVRA